ncbi:alpha/beta hydrolase [Oscillospiraceae bacterium CM]|nr:alpha/beta hydrolase [Oscillospiraceae bacterium CM]
MATSVFKSPEARDAFRTVYNGVLNRFPFGHQYVDTAFGRTFILTAGRETAPPVFVFHGSCSNSVFMSQEIIALSQDYRVYAVDLLGEAGNSAEFRPNLESDAFTLWLKDIFDALSVESAVMLGSSLGGWLALKFATAYPARVSRLILIAPGGLSGQNHEYTIKADSARARNETLTMDEAVIGDAALPKEVVDFMNLILASYNPITAILPVFTDDQLRRLVMPVLFIGGENDILLDAPGAARRISENLPHAEVHLLPNTGHIILNASDYFIPFLQKEVSP